MKLIRQSKKKIENLFYTRIFLIRRQNGFPIKTSWRRTFFKYFLITFCGVITCFLYFNVYGPLFKPWEKQIEKQIDNKMGTNINQKRREFLILIWKYGPFLERRHIKRFTKLKHSPWENCSVKCLLSYAPEKLNQADAVLFFLHRTKTPKELPTRKNYHQKWIFLSDETPLHTFLFNHQNISHYNGIFNWSMTYKTESDIPVPYGRTVPIEPQKLPPKIIKTLKNKDKLVAIMGSNCGGKNGRWSYVRRLKKLLGNRLDIFGRCLNGNKTACPGHFDKDCSHLADYKFYLAFENSNCAEYLTEKVFWNAYEKLAVPVIMGASRDDCKKLLPPFSFLHVDDFLGPEALVDFFNEFDRDFEAYMRFHKWRENYEVLNEHGYFGSSSWHYCRICETLHRGINKTKTYNDLEQFWSVKDCDLKMWKFDDS